MRGSGVALEPSKYKTRWGWIATFVVAIVAILVLLVIYQATVPVDRRPPPRWLVLKGR